MNKEEIDKIREKYKTTKDNFIDEKYANIRFDISFFKDFEILLNYIDKLQKENEELKQDNYNLDRENQLKFDKIIKENEDMREELQMYVDTDVMKLQEENKDLKKEIDNLIKENHKHIDYIASMKKKQEDKIRTKIKELEEMEVYGVLFETAVNFAIKVLKELLGE